MKVNNYIGQRINIGQQPRLGAVAEVQVAEAGPFEPCHPAARWGRGAEATARRRASSSSPGRPVSTRRLCATMAVNLQISLLTPSFGFLMVCLLGITPQEITIVTYATV